MRALHIAFVLAAMLPWIAAPSLAQPVAILTELMASNQSHSFDPLFNDTADWFEVRNTSNQVLNLGGYYVTDDLNALRKWRIPSTVVLPPGGRQLFWADGEDTLNHTNFRLSAGGEPLALVSPDGVIIDQITFGPQHTDVSYGRLADGTWRFFAEPTPGRANTTQPYEGVAATPTTSLPSGFYFGAVTVDVATATPESLIRYTTDGREPTEDDALYDASAPLTFTATTTLRFAAFRPGYIPSPLGTRTYLVNETITLPVIALTTHPDNFFSDERGIYVEGTNGITGRCRTFPVNWNQDWEHPVHIEFFEPDGTLGFAQDAGVKMFGGCGRIYPQKSLALMARRIYGEAKFDYRIFPDQDIDAYNNLVLRSSGQDWWRTMFRDGMIQTVAGDGLDLDRQAFRPAVVFLNGAYWGIHNIREKLNAHYVEAHHGVDDDEVELYDSEKLSLAGRSERYDALLTYLELEDLNTPAAYAYIVSQIDVDAYIDYQIAQIYSANGDWPGNNLKFWRPTTPEGRWRWMFFDLDFGFGGNSEGRAEMNTLAQATAPNGPVWPNPPWSTFIFRKLLENDTFRHTFIQRYAFHVQTTFETDQVLSVIDSLQAHIADEIPRHKARWPRSMSFGATWDDLIALMRDFAQDRPAETRQHFATHFGLSGTAALTANVNDASMGAVTVAGQLLPALPFTTTLFRDVPTQLIAQPAAGYELDRWEGIAATGDTVSVTLSGPMAVTAVFKPAATNTSSADQPTEVTTALEVPYPNPARHHATVAFSLSEAQRVSVTVYDLLGRAQQVALSDASYTAGPHRVTVRLSTLAAGLYRVVLTTEERSLSQPLVVVR